MNWQECSRSCKEKDAEAGNILINQAKYADTDLNKTSGKEMPSKRPNSKRFTSSSHLVAAIALAASLSSSIIYSSSTSAAPAANSEMTVDQAIVKAAMARQQKNHHEALRILRQVESKAGSVAGFYAERAANYIDAGDLEKAKADCLKAIKLNPRLSDAHDRLAYYYAQTNKPLLAINEYSQVIKLNPKSPKPYYNRALAYKKLGKLQEAGRDLQEFDKVSKVLARREEESSVLETVNKQLREGNKKNAIEALESAQKFFPSAAYAYNLAVLYEEQKQYPKALRYFDETIKLAKGDQEKTSTLAFAFLDKGNLLSKLKKYQEAVQSFSDLLALCQKGHPVNSVNALLKEYKKLALGERARNYLLLKDIDKALADCNALLKLNPKAGIAYQIRSAIYKVQGKASLAAADESKAKKLGINSVIDTSLLLSSPDGGYKKAYDEITKVIEEHPDHPHPYKDRAYLSLRSKYYKPAIDDFTTVLKMTPDDASILLVRGECYFMLNDFKNAKEDFNRVISISPEKSQAAYAWKLKIDKATGQAKETTRNTAD